MLIPEEQRRLALDVVRRLREAGYTAYWAGGCVRDQLLGRTPKDYDVATDATPPQIRQLFGRRHTLAIGAAFGVVSVVGPKKAGMVEVATFRSDAAYSDGRHPDSVTFSSPREDAARRDFTINGLFFDPVAQQVIDFVGGQQDLAAHCIRAIGEPRHRIAEDKLRMLRAVRFAAAFAFALDAETQQAIRDMAGEITVVSPERIAMEMRRMLVDANRAVAVRLLLETGLADVVLPEIVPHSPAEQNRFQDTLGLLTRLGTSAADAGVSSTPGFPLALAALLQRWVAPAQAEAICQRWRLANKETDRVVWLVSHHDALCDVQAMRWSAVQPLLIAEGTEDLLRLMVAATSPDSPAVIRCRELLEQPRETLDPPPLVTGQDLLDLGLRAGPQFKTLLQQIRDAQLDGALLTKAAALAWAKKMASG